MKGSDVRVLIGVAQPEGQVTRMLGGTTLGSGGEGVGSCRKGEILVLLSMRDWRAKEQTKEDQRCVYW